MERSGSKWCADCGEKKEKIRRRGETPLNGVCQMIGTIGGSEVGGGGKKIGREDSTSHRTKQSEYEGVCVCGRSGHRLIPGPAAGRDTNRVLRIRNVTQRPEFSGVYLPGRVFHSRSMCRHCQIQLNRTLPNEFIGQ
jgi:hypothetical protein